MAKMRIKAKRGGSSSVMVFSCYLFRVLWCSGSGSAAAAGM